MKAKVNKVKIHVVQDNLLLQDVDAVVNDTTPNLMLPDDWHERVGEELVQALFLNGYCDVGSAIVTSAGNLPYQAIIHTVGPRWADESARGKLANATWRTLELAEETQLNSIGITPLSVGANGYPLENCARIMLQEMIDFTFERLKYLRAIYICTTTDLEQDIFEQELASQVQKLKDDGDGKVTV